MKHPEPEHDLMTPAEVGLLLRVSPRTVTRWARAGALRTAARTPGGHRRYARTDVLAFVVPDGAR
jgi:excisionase family DNA binding protein